MSNLPRVSVVLPSFNRRSELHQAIVCLLRQTHPAHEIIIVDDGSTDGTRQSLSDTFGSRISILTQPNAGPASARNRGVLAATGDLIAFTDSDCMPADNWIAQLVSGFDSQAVAGTGGYVQRASDGVIAEYIDAAGWLNPTMDEGTVTHLVTANACFFRHILIEADLFDERFTKPGGEETELSVRVRKLGYTLRYMPDAVVRHSHKLRLDDLLKVMSNYGEGWFLTSTLWPEEKRFHNAARQPWRTLLLMRHGGHRINGYRKQFGLGRAAQFGILDAVAFAAHRFGFIRAQRHSTRSKAVRSASIGTATR